MAWPLGKRRRRTTPGLPRLNPYDLGWVTALLEGEGSFSVTKPRRDGGRSGIIVSIGMNDKDVLDRFVRVLGNHEKVTPMRHLKRGRSGWQVHVNGYRAADLIELIQSGLGNRRASRAREVLDSWQ